ncbi:MAG: DNA polymerase ligase N-terminal domain-containing protein, partial [Calditrichia bacterium]
MGLKEYHKKRDFKKTGEPRGNEKPSTSGRLYIIQKHAASRLHYDFRLELDGVLKSWAVPKGPSLDPTDKRLAVHVEDHPVDYGSFEGIIPKNEYGGGTVMLWDRGEWEPLGDPAEMYKKGDLKFALHGEKLQGTWALVRMSGKMSDGGKNWLLIKKKDDAARSKKDSEIVKEETRSVASGRSMDEIADAEDSVWKNGQAVSTQKKSKKKPAAAEDLPDPASLKGSKKAAWPKSVKPQLATLTQDPPAGDQYLHEIKFDGYRILCLLKDKKVKL